MTTTALPTLRILIVEDEDDWVYLMKRALEDEAKDRGLVKPIIEEARAADTARHLMARQHFHLMSLDMRLPAGPMDSAVSEVNGVDLAQGPWLAALLPKTIIYSATLEADGDGKYAASGMTVAQLPLDKYGKSSGAKSASTASSIETLSPMEWARRVLDYLDYGKRELQIPPPPGAKTAPKETALGALLRGAAQGLPPALARLAQELQRDWPATGQHRISAAAVDTALKFIESSLRLAVAQTAVLLRKKPANCGLPSTNSQKELIDLLRRWRSDKDSTPTQWTWFTAYLTTEAVNAFDAARALRNESRHGLAAHKAKGEWNELYPLLLKIMDVSSYWAKHPLIGDLHFLPGDGWKGEILCGTGFPRPVKPLGSKDLPGEAVRGIWQLPPRLTDSGKDYAEAARCWDDWLRPDPHDGRPLWLAFFKTPKEIRAWDLAEGERPASFPVA
ncbi:hypothetical protein [Zoogloea sp.]|uniref:hypothetical protein n=1 Tax=Zoogloea sp. TaxID=49181 RepID=UPI001D430409|nr:hypothetical protein [Zoogloea sp.]MBK6654531.1 hypothetical protein [Zoogloea sp.]MBK7846689.1 hypothetical protein [Zoogloea sp.]